MRVMMNAPTINREEHWENVYRTKSPREVSWYQEQPATSLRLIEAAGLDRNDAVIDVGGGASLLVDHLLNAGFRKPAVLDVSATALSHARARLGARADQVEWIAKDVLEFRPAQRFALWHDRAVFHFLTDLSDQARYVESLRASLALNGHVIIGTFAIDGPQKCSGLEVMRHDAARITAALGEEFALVEQVDETHITPWKSQQKFSYFRLRRQA